MSNEPIVAGNDTVMSSTDWDRTLRRHSPLASFEPFESHMMSQLQRAPTFVFNHDLVLTQVLNVTQRYSTLTLPGCLVSHLLPVPFDPAKESVKMQYMMASPIGRGTLLCLSDCE